MATEDFTGTDTVVETGLDRASLNDTLPNWLRSFCIKGTPPDSSAMLSAFARFATNMRAGLDVIGDPDADVDAPTLATILCDQAQDILDLRERWSDAQSVDQVPALGENLSYAYRSHQELTNMLASVYRYVMEPSRTGTRIDLGWQVETMRDR